MNSVYLKFISLTCLMACLQLRLLSQELIVDSSQFKQRSMEKSTIDLSIFRQQDQPRFFVNSKNRSLIMERKDTIKYRNEFFLDSMERHNDHEWNYEKIDTIHVTFPDVEIWNWEKCTQLFDYQSEHIHLDHKKLLNKWFKNTDSIVACKALSLNGDAQSDLAILRKVRMQDIEEDSVTHEWIELQTYKTFYQLELYLQRENNYHLIHDALFDISELKYIYIANFRIKDNKMIYFARNKLTNVIDFPHNVWCHPLKVVYIKLD